MGDLLQHGLPALLEAVGVGGAFTRARGLDGGAHLRHDARIGALGLATLEGGVRARGDAEHRRDDQCDR
jgi:hypothetical protein